MAAAGLPAWQAWQHPAALIVLVPWLAHQLVLLFRQTVTPLPMHAVFDLANLWLEQQQRQQLPQQQRQDSQAVEEQRPALAALVWRRPVAADFLRCMAANLPWAADYVAASPQRPDRLPASLDGKFSFTAEVRIAAAAGMAAAAAAAAAAIGPMPAATLIPPSCPPTYPPVLSSLPCSSSCTTFWSCSKEPWQRGGPSSSSRRPYTAVDTAGGR